LLDYVPLLEFGAQCDLVKLILAFVKLILKRLVFSLLVFFLRFPVNYALLKPVGLRLEVLSFEVTLYHQNLELLLHGLNHYSLLC